MWNTFFSLFRNFFSLPPAAAAAPSPDVKSHFSRIDTGGMYPPFVEMCEKLVAACLSRGAIYVAICGERSWAEQDALFARGRTAAPIGPGHIVTKARGGQSPHNFACAIDFARHRGTTWEGKLVPDFSDSANRILAEEAEKMGLESGYYWPKGFVDSPHVQLPIKKMGLSWRQLADTWKTHGKAAVFEEFDKKMALLKI